MKISIAQLNYHIGNFQKNQELICDAIAAARSEGSDLIVFSELSVPGYPPLDLLDHIDFVRKCEETVSEIAKKCIGIAAVVMGIRQDADLHEVACVYKALHRRVLPEMA